jgi:hypothetical protein
MIMDTVEVETKKADQDEFYQDSSEQERLVHR